MCREGWTLRWVQLSTDSFHIPITIMAKSNNIREALSGHLLKECTLDAYRLGIVTKDSVSEVYRFKDEAETTNSTRDTTNAR